jgi:cob(I)alamin adenosyltransferase
MSLIHIYTGTGKGKTTSAIGLCARALGHGFNVCYASFHKNPQKYGYNEMNSLNKLGAQVLNFAKGHPHLDPTMDIDKISNEALEGVQYLEKLVNKDNIDLLIMDEIIISVRDGFLDEQVLINFVKNKPKNLELVLTGRGATKELITLADYVSEVNCIAHPYEKGIESRKGIEF